MKVNTYDKTYQDAVQSFNNAISKIDSENIEAEFINLDYHMALIKMAIKKQFSGVKNANTL